MLPLRSVGRSNFDNGLHNLTTLIQKNIPLYMRNMKEGENVMLQENQTQHFNPPSHCSLNDFSVTGIIHCNCSNVNRLNIENRIIFKLGTLSPLGLNTKFDAFSLT